MSAPYAIDLLDAVAPHLAARLPWNYLPAAMPALAGQADAGGRHLFALNAAGRAKAETLTTPPDILQDPLAMAAFLAEMQGLFATEPPLTRCILGPPVAGDAPPNRAGVPFVQDAKGRIGGVDRVAVIIDGGIAFWDRAFRTAKGCRFYEVIFLDLDEHEAGASLDRRLTSPSIRDLCAMADSEGPRAVVRALGEAYPQSFYGKGHGADLGTGWHGTGVADLLAGGPAAGVAKVALFGVELPWSVLRDYDGDSLTAILSLTLELVFAATARFAHLPLVVVLPFGFVAGPQDGTHPVALSVGETLRQSGRKVDLVVPAGNSRQDRCTARIDPVPAGGASSPVIWRIPPDDFSPNSVDLVLEGVTGPDVARHLRLTPPDGPTQDIALLPDGFALIRRGADVIGAVLRRPDTPAGACMRLVLAGTGRDGSGRQRPTAGDWKIGIGGTEGAHLYALRDDRDIVADRGRPRRKAVFAETGYRETQSTGAPVMDDMGAGQIRRAGTASVLVTIPGVVQVRADERLGDGPPKAAPYSGLRADGTECPSAELVDDGWQLRGVECAANGTAMRTRLSGTSAAAGLRGRALLGLPPRPTG